MKSKRCVKMIVLILMVSICVIGFTSGQTNAAATGKKALVLISDNGKWTAYEDMAVYSPSGKIMVKVSPAASKLDLTYKKTSSKKFSITNGKNTLIFKKGSKKYQNKTKSSTTALKSKYMAYTAKNNGTSSNVVHYACFSKLVNAKYYSAKNTDYAELGFAAVIVMDKDKKIKRLPNINDVVDKTGKAFSADDSSIVPIIEGAISPDDIPTVLKDTKYPNGYNNPELLYTIGDIEVWGDAIQNVSLPLEHVLERMLIVKNTGSSDLRVYVGEPQISGSAEKYFPNEDGTTTVHPQPAYLYLSPGEERAYVLVATYDFKPNMIGTGIEKSELILTYKAHIYELKEGSYYPVINKDMNFSFNIAAYSESALQESNAKIAGYVTDEVTGKRLEDVSVIAFSGVNRYETRSDSDGYFCFDVLAYKQSYSGTWNTFNIVANMPQEDFGYNCPMNAKEGYGQARSVVGAVEGETTGIILSLPKQTQGFHYEQTKVIDIDLQAYSYDASEDGEVIAFIPFHTELPLSEQQKRAYLNVTDKTGKELFKAKLPYETPAGDVTPDGRYIATAYEDTVTPDISAVIYDTSGKLLYKTPKLPLVDSKWVTEDQEPYLIREVRMSDNGKYLAVGDANIGQFWLIDWQNDKVLWSTFCYGQVRSIHFDNNDSLIYISLGSGYIYCYTIDGKFLWESYVGSWATTMSVTENYIAATVKSCACSLSLIDKKTGKNIWYYPGGYRGSGVRISPDETMVWWGNDVAGGMASVMNIILDINGRPIFAPYGSGQMAGFTADSNYIAVKNGKQIALYDRNGQLIWIDNIVNSDDNRTSAINATLYISDDGKYIVTAVNNDPSYRCLGQVYYYKRVDEP